MPQYRLRQQNGDIELPPGEILIGRGQDCQIVLDDTIVSRRHAILRVAAAVELEDLGSRNGVLVNGDRVGSGQKRLLAVGDLIQIGGQELTLIEAASSERQVTREISLRRRQSTLTDMQAIEGEETRTTRLSTLLFGVAQKLLAQGKVDEAVRIFANGAADLRSQIDQGKQVPPELLEEAARRAADLAAAGKRDHVDWIFDTYHRAGRVLPGPLVDELLVLVRRTRYPAGAPLRSYLESLRESAAGLSPADRFVVNRLESLLAVASTFR